MILIGGASDTNQDGTGAFQEAPQVEACRPFVKYAARPDSIERIPFFVEKAVRQSTYGRPGAVYLDIPGNLLQGQADDGDVCVPAPCAPPPRPLAEPKSVTAALALLATAERPLVIVGKGAAAAFAEDGVRSFVDATGLPFLATPMGKGVVPDDHPQSVAAARSLALRRADVVLLIGARLNWILHFGLPPRWHKDVKIIQLDICPEELSTNVPATVSLCGHAASVMDQLNGSCELRFPADSAWWAELREKIDVNTGRVQERMSNDAVPMSYYRVFKDVRAVLPRDAIIVSEGANTMDIGRTLMPNFLPRHRLDAGTFGTMGVGLGFAIAAAVVHPGKKVVAVEGDSAFGFSGMELETACRYRLPITFVVVNNNGIYQGLEETPDDPDTAPVTSLTVNARYDKLAAAFGAKGYYVTRPEDLLPALREAMADTVPSVVNVMIDPFGARAPQEFEWLTRSKL